MTRTYRDYSDLDIQIAVANSKSIADVCRNLGIKPVGGNYQTARVHIQRLNLDTSHFTGQGWSKGKQLKQIGNYSRPHKIKKKKLAEHRGWICENCNITEWLGKKVPLECHHIDKDRSNNHPSNLMLLCRNCHFWVHNKH